MTVGDRIRKCLAGPMTPNVLADVVVLADMLRAKGLDYNGSMAVVEQANKGTVAYPRDTWEELLHAADRWTSLR